jgi:hypothetical protein
MEQPNHSTTPHDSSTPRDIEKASARNVTTSGGKTQDVAGLSIPLEVHDYYEPLRDNTTLLNELCEAVSAQGNSAPESIDGTGLVSSERYSTARYSRLIHVSTYYRSVF